MHPEVVSHTPGECPICRMELERVSDGGSARISAAANPNLVGAAKRKVITQLVRAPAWLDAGVVTAVLHKDDLVGITPGAHALFYGTTTSRTGIDLRLASDRPAPWDSSTLQVRFEVVEKGVASKGRALAQGPSGSTPAATRDTGWLDLAPRPRDLLVVPASAVLYTADGPYVVAASSDGKTFTKRSIEIGRILDSGYVAELSKDRFGAIVVLSGLHESEQVVVEDTFFLDAERRLQEGRGIGPQVTQ
jgi:Heavy metal binding domain